MTQEDLVDVAPIVVSVAALVVSMAVAYWARRSEQRERRRSIVLEESAKIISFEYAYRIYVWQRFGPGQNKHPDTPNDGSVVPLSSEKRLSEAKIRLATADRQLLARMDELADAGRAIGRTKDKGIVFVDVDFQEASQEHADAIERFLLEAARVVGVRER